MRWEGGYFKLLQPWPRQTLGKHARKPVQGLRGVHIPSRCEVTGSGYLPGRGKCVYTWGLSSLCRTFNCSVGTISWGPKKRENTPFLSSDRDPKFLGPPVNPLQPGKLPGTRACVQPFPHSKVTRTRLRARPSSSGAREVLLGLSRACQPLQRTASAPAVCD